MKMKNAVIGRALCAFALLLAVATPGTAQEDDSLRKELEALRQGQEAMQKQLDEIKKLLETRAAPAGPNVKDVVFDLGDNPTKGSSDAPLTLIEFTDYQCPFCARWTSQTLPQLNDEYVKTGKVRLALLDLPLESIHKQAFKAAEASHCAEEQGKFWEMHDRLFEKHRELEPWNAHAEAVGLDAAKFEACLSSGKYAEAVRRDMAQAQRAGATGTPAFVLARTDGADKNKVKGITALKGAQAFNAFKAAIDEALGAGK
jgi:protein-disulfide isomerase